MARRRFIVAYDIRDDRRLRRVCEVTKNYGKRLQYSVFVCDLSDRELLWLKRDLGDTMNQGLDSVVIVDLGDAETRGTQCFDFLGHRQYDLPRSGPLVW